MRERAFFSHPGGINEESIRKTITLARKNAAKRRAYKLQQPTKHAADDSVENDTTEQISIIPVKYKNDSLDIADDALHGSVKLVKRKEDNTIRGKKDLSVADNQRGGSEKSQPTLSPQVTEKSEKYSRVEPDRKLGHKDSVIQNEGLEVNCPVMERKKGQVKGIAKSQNSPLATFKARPLPGGIWVENDIFASTEAARGKDKRLNCKIAAIDVAAEAERLANGLNESFKIRKRKDVSMSPSFASDSHGIDRFAYKQKNWHSVSSAVSSFEEDFSCTVGHNSPKASRMLAVDHKERALMKDIKMLNNMMKSAKEFSSTPISATDAWSESDCEMSLEREVAKLEKKLARRKKLTLEIKQFLGFNETTTLISDDSKESADWDSITRGSKQLNQSSDETQRSFLPDNSFVADIILQTQKTDPHSTVYKRQERWLQAKEQRLRENRISRMMVSMEGFTGAPIISNTKRSWGKAKLAHELAVQQQLQEEKRRENEKATRLHHAELSKGKELEDLRAEAEKRKRGQKSKADPAKQQEAIEKLARPRIGQKPVILKEERRGVEEAPTDCAQIFGSKRLRKVASKKKPSRRAGKYKLPLSTHVSFADMDDIEFARVMKSIGIDMDTHKPSPKRELT